MKTIFITCFQGMISRNILSTDALSVLDREKDVRVVILAAERVADDLQREFSRPNVIVEPVPVHAPVGRDLFFWTLATNLLTSETREVQRRAKLARDHNYFDYLGSKLTSLFGRLYMVRALFRAMVSRIESQTEFEKFFEKYQPHLLFATDVYTLQDAKLMRLAKKRGVKTIGMVRSWDNVTSKTLLTIIPEQMLISTEAMAEELVSYGDIPQKRIMLCSVPHYDRYTGERRTPREEFFHSLGLDPEKKLILFTPPSDNYLRGDPVTPVVLKALASLPVQILVRLALVGKTDFGGVAASPNVVYDQPHNSGNFTEVHLSPVADHHLADSLFYSDVVVTWASTMIVDAVAFGKPVALVGFDAVKRPYGTSIQQYYDYSHQVKIRETGGARLAKTPDELREIVRRYLERPETDVEGRERIRHDYIGQMDGHAGERLGKLLLEALQNQ